MKRDPYFDIFRGVVIVDMVLVHYASYFPSIIGKMLVYHDVAMDGFLLISGYMVGNHYYPKYIGDKLSVSIKLVVRALKIVVINSILILTIGWSYFVLMERNYLSGDTVNFILESLGFYNQIGIIHILPTFVPIFCISPMVLYILSLGCDYLMLFLSGVLFVFGLWQPYFFSYGTPPIFPVILWQIYFIFGCLLGKRSLYVSWNKVKSRKVELISFFLCFLLLIFMHSNSLSSSLTQFKSFHDINFRRYPINVYGLVYSLALLNVLRIVIYKLVVYRGKYKLLNVVEFYGRNSLLFFFLHVYFAMIIKIIYTLYKPNIALIYILILLNFVSAYFVLDVFESFKFNSRSRMARSVKILFS